MAKISWKILISSGKIRKQKCENAQFSSKKFSLSQSVNIYVSGGQTKVFSVKHRISISAFLQHFGNIYLYLLHHQQCFWRNFYGRIYTVSQKNWTLFRSFEHNFGKYCPILIILSLLQTEINCDQVYRNIYHQTPNLLVHYLVKWTMYWPTLLAWFRN